MATVREIVAKLGFKADVSGAKKWEAATTSATRRVAGVAKRAATQIRHSLGNAFTITGGDVVGLISHVRDLGLELAGAGDLAAKTGQALGMTAEQWQQWQHVAALSGASAEEMRTAMDDLSKGVQEAAFKGTGPFIEGMQALGLSMDEPAIQSQDLNEIFGFLSDELSELPDGLNKTAIAVKLFGGAGHRLVPLLNAGSEGIAEMKQEASDLGKVLSNEAAANSEKFNDALERAQSVIHGMAASVVSELLPVATEWLIAQRTWIDQNREVLQQDVISVVHGLAEAVRAIIPVVRDSVSTLGKFVDAVGGTENAMLIAIPTVTAFAVAASGIAGPWGIAAAAMIAAIPAVVRLGDEIANVLVDATRLEAQLRAYDESEFGGRTTVRGNESLGGALADEERARGFMIDKRGLSAAHRRIDKLSDAQIKTLIDKGTINGEAQPPLAREMAREVIAVRQLDASQAAINQSIAGTTRKAATRFARRAQAALGKHGATIAGAVLSPTAALADRAAELAPKAKPKAPRTGGRGAPKPKGPAQPEELTIEEILERDFGGGLGEAIGSLPGGSKIRPTLGTTINKITNTYAPEMTVTIPVTQRQGEDAGGLATRVRDVVRAEVTTIIRNGTEHFQGARLAKGAG